MGREVPQVSQSVVRLPVLTGGHLPPRLDLRAAADQRLGPAVFQQVRQAAEDLGIADQSLMGFFEEIFLDAPDPRTGQRSASDLLRAPCE